MSTLNETPAANRIHIGFFGKRNSGKSSLVNAFSGQSVSIVSNVAGTTTDPVYKAMEINGLGAAVLIDTAGFDDIGPLGEIRVEKTKKAADRTDIAVILFTGPDITRELHWFRYFKERGTTAIPVISKTDAVEPGEPFIRRVEDAVSARPLLVSAVSGEGIEELRARIIESLPDTDTNRSILGNMVSEGDLALLVMPQDIQAPTGRLILPQVQTIRELLDKKCLVMCAAADTFIEAIDKLKAPPDLIITDSQVFDVVFKNKPEISRLTSFSILFAGYKGDLPYYLEGVNQVEKLTENSRVLIAECCTHAPLGEDIGRVKIPRILRGKAGDGITIDVCGGADFPDSLSDYDLIIQCGGCMFNRKHIMNRIGKAMAQGVPMTNYGVFLAHMSGILDKIAY